jgi:hypothetical protein
VDGLAWPNTTTVNVLVFVCHIIAQGWKLPKNLKQCFFPAHDAAVTFMQVFTSVFSVTAFY